MIGLSLVSQECEGENETAKHQSIPGAFRADAISKMNLSAGTMAQLAKSVLCKCDDLRSDVSACLLKHLGLAVHACHPSAEETETGGSLGLTDQSVKLNPSAPGTVKDPVSKNMRQTEREEKIQGHPLISTCYAHILIHTQ